MVVISLFLMVIESITSSGLIPKYNNVVKI